MAFRRWPRRARFAAALAAVSVLAGSVAIAAGVAASRSADRASKIVAGDLLVFTTGAPPPLNPAGTELLAFNLPAGSWLLVGGVVAVKSNGEAITLECVLRGQGQADVDGHVGLPGRGLRNVTLETAVALAKAKTYRVRCRLFPVKPSPVSVTNVWVHALRVKSIAFKKPLF